MSLTAYQKSQIDKLLMEDDKDFFTQGIFSLSVNKKEGENNRFYPGKQTGDFFLEVYEYLKDRSNDQKVFLDQILQIDEYNLKKMIKDSDEFKEILENHQKEKQNSDQKAQKNPEIALTDYQKREIEKFLEGIQSKNFLDLAVNPEGNKNTKISAKKAGQFFIKVLKYLENRSSDKKLFLDEISKYNTQIQEEIKNNSPEFKEILENHQKAQQNPPTNLTLSGKAQLTEKQTDWEHKF